MTHLRSMTYAEAKAEADRLNAAAKEAGRALDGFARGAFNLVTNEAKATLAYQMARAEFERAFARQRAFNAIYVKQFRAEIAADRAARFAGKT